MSSSSDSDEEYVLTPLNDAAFAGNYEAVAAILKEMRQSHQEEGVMGSTNGDNGEEASKGPSSSSALTTTSPSFTADTSRDSFGCTPLHDAARQGHMAIVDLLIREGNCDPNALCGSRRTPLHEAAKFGQMAVVRLLINDHAADPSLRCEKGRNALHMAAANGRDEVVAYLVGVGDEQQEGAGERPIGSASRPPALLAIDINAKDRRGYTALHLGAARGHLAAVRHLAGRDSYGNAGGGGGMMTSSTHPALVKGRFDDYPLHSAASNGHASTVEYLYDRMVALSSKKDDDVAADTTPSSILNTKDRFGRTPYYLAGCGDWTDAMATLKRLGCDPLLTDNKGRMPNA